MDEDKQKYYWIKLRTNFFSDVENPAIDFLMSQPNGAEYVVLYQMLLLKTANKHGHLSDSIGEVIIPYDPSKIARDTKYFDEDTVRVAMDWFVKLGLVYRDEGNELVIVDSDKYVGSESASKAAVKKRNYRENLRIKANSASEEIGADTSVDSEVDKVGTKCPTEIRDKRLEIRDKSIEYRDRVKNLKEKEKIDSNESIRQTETVCGSHFDDEKPHVPVKKIVEMWNTLTEFGITPVTKIDSKSKRYIAARARGYQYTEEDFQKAIDNIRHSDFLCGKKTDFIITFDWFVKASNFEKVYDGNYNNRENTSGGSKLDEWLKEE